MTKNEIINEIKSVVMNNGGEVNLGWVTISVINGEVVRTLHGYSKNVKYEKVAQIQIYLDCLNDMEAETVETKVENTENTVEVEKNDNDVNNMTKNEIINKIEKFMGNVDYFHYFKFMNGKNETKTSLNCALIGDDGIMYYRYFGDSDSIHFKKLKNCTKAELIMVYGVCKLYIDHMNSKLNEAA